MQDKEKPTEQYYPGSVLLSDHIKRLVQDGLLIVSDPLYERGSDTFDKQQLDRAKYNVRLGRTYCKAVKFQKLDDEENPLLVVKPYELVFVESYEVFKMPENVVGVYDLRISGCLNGLGLQTGLQLGPTYHGRFFCSLFNFSDNEVSLKYKDQLASIQFIYTTPPTPETKKYEGKQVLFSLTQVLAEPRRSGLERLWADIQGIQESVKSGLNRYDDIATRMHTRVDTMVGAVFHAMAFMVAALAVMAAAISIVITSVITPPFSVKALPLSIGLIILFGVLFGAEFWILKAMRKYR